VLKVLCPIEERKHWFYSLKTIPLERVTCIERWQVDSSCYAEMSTFEVQALCQQIKAEIDRAFDFVKCRYGAMGVRLKPGACASWLLDAHGTELAVA
jgi:hypothetical protein